MRFNELKEKYYKDINEKLEEITMLSILEYADIKNYKIDLFKIQMILNFVWLGIIGFISLLFNLIISNRIIDIVFIIMLLSGFGFIQIAKNRLIKKYIEIKNKITKNIKL